MEAPDLDELKNKHIHGFLKGLMVRDLRHLSRARGVEDYKTMKKGDLVQHLFDKHFMAGRDKEKFKPRKQDDEAHPLPNFAGRPAGLTTLKGRSKFDGAVKNKGVKFSERLVSSGEANTPLLPEGTQKAKK